MSWTVSILVTKLFNLRALATIATIITPQRQFHAVTELFSVYC